MKETIERWITPFKIYAPDANLLKANGYPIRGDQFIKPDASNVVAFWDEMLGSNPEVIQRIKQDVKTCIPEITDIRIESIRENTAKYSELKTKFGREDRFKQLFVIDDKAVRYYTDELSEGVLYFIALLAIIHQPNPPRLLAIEEPD
ncbi:MAG: hypothetical protein HC880_02370 [Bacteroidia bacterium]|nr:hypothetical protein [Bacteroidia bacterium]